MIYRVGDNDNNRYDYNRLKTPQSSGSEEKFSLDYRREDELSSKKEDDQEEDKKLHEKSSDVIKRQKSGVMLELSNPEGRHVDNGMAKAKRTDNEAGNATLFASLREIFQKIVQAVKDVFDKIWNDPESETAVQSSDVTPEEAERYTEEYMALKGITKPESSEDASQEKQEAAIDKDTEIQKYLHSGNLDQVISLLTDNGQKTIAKNSSLLTYYDRSGRLKPINPSDRERILHGDRNTKKL